MKVPGISSFAQANVITGYIQFTERKKKQTNIVMEALDMYPGGLGFLLRSTINSQCALAQMN